MGGTSSSSYQSQKPLPLSDVERKLQGIQLTFARQMLDEFMQQQEFQALQRGLAPAATSEIASMQDPLSALQAGEQAGLTREAYEQALSGSRRAGELSDMELERIRRGGEVSPQQASLIRAAADAEMESGLRDISRYAGQQREAVSSELAPRLGMHRYDTPILDRGNRIAAEAVNAAGRLASDVRGREAQAMLSYPLAANEAASAATQAQQSLGWNRADVLADLNQRAYQNRLSLLGQGGQLGLGLATGYNVPGAQQSMHPVLQSFGETRSAGGGISFGSSRKIKEILATPNGAEVLNALAKLPVAFWRYLAGDDAEHIGPFAEDMREAFGIGDGETIDLRDLTGVLLVGVQQLAGRITELEKSRA